MVERFNVTAVNFAQPRLCEYHISGSLEYWRKVTCYLNGELIGTYSVVTPSTFDGSGNAYLSKQVGTEVFRWRISAGSIRPEQLDAARHELYTRNPWQLFAKRARSPLLRLASGTSFSGTPGLGSLVKTGRGAVSPGPVLVIGYNFAPAVGSAVKTGLTPNLTRAFNFAPGAGSLVKTGEIPTLTRRFNFVPGAGSMPKTGEIPNLTIAYKLQPIPGSMTKTGYAPLLFAPMTPSAGSIVKTGYAPTLIIGGGGTGGKNKNSWHVKAIGVKTKIDVHSQVDSDTGDTP